MAVSGQENKFEPPEFLESGSTTQVNFIRGGSVTDRLPQDSSNRPGRTDPSSRVEALPEAVEVPVRYEPHVMETILECSNQIGKWTRPN